MLHKQATVLEGEYRETVEDLGPARPLLQEDKDKPLYTRRRNTMNSGKYNLSPEFELNGIGSRGMRLA